jgi:endoglycosylceramidase
VRAEPLPDLRLHVQGTRLLDSNGREVLLRGVNAGGHSKTPPFFPFPFRESGLPTQSGSAPFAAAAARYLDLVAGMGHNFLRMPFTWEAVEPQDGKLDTTYLDRLERFVDLAAARGIRVVLDSHQDLVSRAYGGDGFPSWVLSKPQAHAPAYQKLLWPLGYMLNGDVKRDLQRFWKNDAGMQDRYIEMLSAVARRFGEKSNVVGIELINEPAAGTLNQERWSREVLTAFHERAGEAVRRAAPKLLTVFGGTGADGVRGRTDTQLPGGDGWVFAPHAYDGSRLMAAQLGAPNTLERWLPEYRPREAMQAWAKQADSWGVPLVIGEHGAPRTFRSAPKQLSAFLDAADEAKSSVATWELTVFTDEARDDWNHERMSLMPAGERTPSSDAVTRPYPAAVAGRIASFSWDAGNKRGALAYEAVAGRVSEIALPRALVNGQPKVKVRSDANVTWRWDKLSQRLLIRSGEAAHVGVYFEV